jgi:phosphoribosyl-ATP pyrophosphohydrolase/phosphoribosyl-AMP cyclohydrolase
VIDPAAVAWDASGLVPGVVQDAGTGRVLMLAYVNRAALDATLATGEAHFWSRSRNELWRKGATSGNTLAVVDIHTDCDRDALLITVRPEGPACHTGAVSCFGGSDEEPGQGFAALEQLWATIADRAAHRPAGSYTTTLLAGGVDATARKLLEEAGETVLAAKDHATGTTDDLRVAEEAADLLYHLLVLLAEREIAPGTVLAVLAQRAEGGKPAPP